MSTFGAEHAINEFAFKKDFKTCHFEYRFGDILDANDFKTEDDFYDEISRWFEKLYDTSYKMIHPMNKREGWLTDEQWKIFEERQARKYSD